jgi:MFS transporter, DHA1 family, tetracycline resistance protein
MLALFLVVFVGLMGVALVIPLFPFFALRIGMGADTITLLMAVYAAGQFIAAPIWGKLSDKIGRKPVFLISTAGGALSYVLLGFADSIESLLIARAVGGLMAGNVAVAFAAVADLTAPEDRAKGMGTIGGAFSLGFIAGPAMGGLIAGNDAAAANLALIAGVACALNALAFVVTLMLLRETRAHASPSSTEARLHPRGLGFGRVAANPPLLMLIFLGLIYTAAGSMLDTTFALFANTALDYGPRDIGFLFSYLGVVAGMVQMTAIGPLVKRFGDAAIVKGGIIIYGVGLMILISTEWLPLVLVAMTCISTGNSLFQPGSSSLISRLSPAQDRGFILGLSQAAASFGRVITPIFSGLIFAQYGPHAPFAVGLVMLIPALVLIIAIARASATWHGQDR